MLHASISSTRVLLVCGSAALFAVGAIAACSGFSSEDAGGDSDAGLPDSSINDSTDSATDASLPLADASDGGLPLAQTFYCRDSQDAGHYACLDFEDGGGRPQWAEFSGVGTERGPLEIVSGIFASPSHSAIVHANAYALTPRESNQRRWTISARINTPNDSIAHATYRVSFSGDTRAFALTTSTGGPAKNCSANPSTSICSVKVPVDAGFVTQTLTVFATPADGGFALNAEVTVGDASVASGLNWTSDLKDAVVRFGDSQFDGGVYYDDVTVDIFTEPAPAADAAQ